MISVYHKNQKIEQGDGGKEIFSQIRGFKPEAVVV
jgi:hypothetical protein